MIAQFKAFRQFISIMIDKFWKLNPTVIFALALLSVMLMYSFPFIFTQPPSGIHLWRQTDGLCFTRHYYDNGLNFFDTQIFNLLFKDNTSAKTVGEFPIVYYFVAALWKVFGVHVWIFRLVSLLLFLVGLRSVFMVLKDLTKEVAWSMFAILIIFTSPAVVCYSTSFLPDLHAVSFSLLAIGAFYNYWKCKRINYLYLSMVFFAIAGLIKPTSLIPYFVLVGIFGLEILNVKWKNSIRLFPHKAHAILGFGLVIVINVVWLLWVKFYNDTYGGWFTPNAVFVPWCYSDADYLNYLTLFRSFLVNQDFSRTVLYVLVACIIALFLTHKKESRLPLAAIILTLLGCATYALLFFKWDVHDYYLLVLLVLPILTFALCITRVQQLLPVLLKARTVKFLAFLFLVYNVWYCASNMQLRYHPIADKVYFSSSSEAEVNRFKYENWAFNKSTRALVDIEPYLASIGINTEDKIISLPDDSFNSTLYLMNRHGWTGIESDMKTAEGIEKRIKLGAKYLVVNDMEALINSNFQPSFLSNKIGEFENVQIFQLH